VLIIAKSRTLPPLITTERHLKA